ncbi:MAG: DUF1127 domain-containing protein [Pseudomonadota bacterium]
MKHEDAIRDNGLQHASSKTGPIETTGRFGAHQAGKAEPMNFSAKSFAGRIRARIAEQRAIRDVAELDAHILRDIGLNPDRVQGVNPYASHSFRLMGGR